jgi:hypothetical protein
MRFSCTVFLAACLFLSSALHAEPLITPAESAAEQARLSTEITLPRVRSLSGPRIEVVEPSLRGPLAAPLRIKVRFDAQGAASVVRDSFKVYYGTFGIDITERLLKRARFEDNLLLVDRAEIPAGTHRLRMKIVDSDGRATEKLVTFTVQE